MFDAILNVRFAQTISPHARPTVADPGKAARNTLNEKGTLLYSAIRAANDADNLMHECMHSILNLKPLCIRCNTSKGNSILG